MTFLEFILAVVIIGAVVRLVTHRQQTQADAMRHGDHPDLLAAHDEVRRLKERVQVLERVITDNHGSNALDQEIERLRDR